MLHEREGPGERHRKGSCEEGRGLGSLSNAWQAYEHA